jgi:hypothetical protein
MGARFTAKQKAVAEIMRKHWKNPVGRTVRWIAECLTDVGVIIVACRNGAAIIRKDDPLPPDSIHLKDTNIGIMLSRTGTEKVFELNPVEFKYINQCWWETKNNGEKKTD